MKPLARSRKIRVRAPHLIHPSTITSEKELKEWQRNYGHEV